VHTGIRTAPIFDWMQQCPAHETFPLRDGSVVFLTSKLSDVTTYLPSSLGRYLGSKCSHSSPVTRDHPLPAPCSKVHLMPVSFHSGRAGDLQARGNRGPTLIIIVGGQRRLYSTASPPSPTPASINTQCCCQHPSYWELAVEGMMISCRSSSPASGLWPLVSAARRPPNISCPQCD
jgi:hypothetical protein